MKAVLDAGQSIVRLEGFLQDRLNANLEQWLLPVISANPAMIEMFRLRDRLPRIELVSWYGEFPGKYMTSAVQAWKLTNDGRLKQTIDDLVDDLAQVQDSDGYLGPHPYEERLTGQREDAFKLWEIWGHYHIMLGLNLWHEAAGNETAWKVCIKAADHLCDAFLSGGKKIIDAGWSEMNTAAHHIYAILYKKTGIERYLQMTDLIEKCWEHEEGGDYLRDSLAGKPFFELRKPRWESLHAIQGMAEKYWLTGSDSYRQAYEQIWTTIAQYDRHNTGGFSTAEQACGNPYAEGAIETCCTIAWMALTIDMLRLTGESRIADELELSAFNGMLGAQHPSGRWWTYNTPMNGVKKASAHEIVFQAIQGSPELNCCSVNGPRGIGMFAEWSFMQSDNGFAVNYYGPSRLSGITKADQQLAIIQETEYPLNGSVKLTIQISNPETFELMLRIPQWSVNTRVLVNGAAVKQIMPGYYLTLSHEWKDGDNIELSLDLSLHYWHGEKDKEGLTSLYRGPILLTYDQRFNQKDLQEIPTVRLNSVLSNPVAWQGRQPPWLLVEAKGTNGEPVYLCDFASAGMSGSHYATWLAIADNNTLVSRQGTEPAWIAR